MYLQKIISRKTEFFLGVLKVKDENSRIGFGQRQGSVDPDSNKMSRIHNTGPCTNKISSFSPEQCCESRLLSLDPNPDFCFRDLFCMTDVQGSFEAFSPPQKASQSMNHLQFSFPGGGGGGGTVCLAFLDFSRFWCMSYKT
jgi:hypothetical protein